MAPAWVEISAVEYLPPAKITPGMQALLGSKQQAPQWSEVLLLPAAWLKKGSHGSTEVCLRPEAHCFIINGMHCRKD